MVLYYQQQNSDVHVQWDCVLSLSPPWQLGIISPPLKRGIISPPWKGGIISPPWKHGIISPPWKHGIISQKNCHLHSVAESSAMIMTKHIAKLTGKLSKQ